MVGTFGRDSNIHSAPAHNDRSQAEGSHGSDHEVVQGVKYFRCDPCHEKTSFAPVKAPSPHSFDDEAILNVPCGTHPTNVWILEHDL